MGLRADIYNAIAENLTYTDSDGNVVNPADELGRVGNLTNSHMI